MSARQVHIRLTVNDEKQLDLIAEALGGSRAAAVRYLIRQWMERKTHHNGIQVVNHPPRV